MKRNDFNQLKGADIKELEQKAASLKKEIGDLIMEKNMKKLKDLRIVFKKRKELAQVFTVLKQRQLLSVLESKVENQAPKKGEK